MHPCSACSRLQEPLSEPPWLMLEVTWIPLPLLDVVTRICRTLPLRLVLAVRVEAEATLGSQLDPDGESGTRSRLRVAVAELVYRVIEGKPLGLGTAHHA